MVQAAHMQLHMNCSPVHCVVPEAAEMVLMTGDYSACTAQLPDQTDGCVADLIPFVFEDECLSLCKLFCSGAKLRVALAPSFPPCLSSSNEGCKGSHRFLGAALCVCEQTMQLQCPSVMTPGASS